MTELIVHLCEHHRDQGILYTPCSCEPKHECEVVGCANLANHVETVTAIDVQQLRSELQDIADEMSKL